MTQFNGRGALGWASGSLLWISGITMTSAGCDEADSKPVQMDTTAESTDAGNQTTSHDGIHSQTTSQHASSSRDETTNVTGGSMHDAQTEHDVTSVTRADAAGVMGDAGSGSGVSDASVTTAFDAATDVDSGQDSGLPNDLLERARADYRAWEPRTEEPVAISAEIFALCRLPTQAESEFVDSVHGGELALQDWLNESAREGLAAIAATPSSGNEEPITFAMGATIVKEKVAWREGAWELAALGLMIKREPGFDPSHGDWQFGYWDPELGMESGSAAQASCGECHAFAGTDFVYADDSWRE